MSDTEPIYTPAERRRLYAEARDWHPSGGTWRTTVPRHACGCRIAPKTAGEDLERGRCPDCAAGAYAEG